MPGNWNHRSVIVAHKALKTRSCTARIGTQSAAAATFSAGKRESTWSGCHQSGSAFWTSRVVSFPKQPFPHDLFRQPETPISREFLCTMGMNSDAALMIQDGNSGWVVQPPMLLGWAPPFFNNRLFGSPTSPGDFFGAEKPWKTGQCSPGAKNAQSGKRQGLEDSEKSSRCSVCWFVTMENHNF